MSLGSGFSFPLPLALATCACALSRVYGRMYTSGCTSRSKRAGNSTLPPERQTDPSADGAIAISSQKKMTLALETSSDGADLSNGSRDAAFQNKVCTLAGTQGTHLLGGLRIRPVPGGDDTLHTHNLGDWHTVRLAPGQPAPFPSPPKRGLGS